MVTDLCEICGKSDQHDGLTVCLECLVEMAKQRMPEIVGDLTECSKCGNTRNTKHMVKGRNYCLVCHGYERHRREGGFFGFEQFEQRYFLRVDNRAKFNRGALK